MLVVYEELKRTCVPVYLPDVLPYHMKLDHKKLIVNELLVEDLSYLVSIPSRPNSSCIIPTIQE